MLWAKPSVVKSLGALAGLTVFILILAIPSLPILPVISMSLCLAGFAYVAITSLWMNGTDREELTRKIGQLREDRLSEIVNNILNPHLDLEEASSTTLKRDSDKLQADAILQGANLQHIKRDIKNPTTFTNLQPLAQVALKTEADRLLDLPSKPEPEPEDNAVIVGIGGIFGIIGGLGIAEALINYFGSLHVDLHTIVTSLTQIVTIDWASTYRITGFLATIIPFIHAFIVILTAKWYHNQITNIYHYRLAFLFFIAVIIQTLLFFLLALNVKDVAVYILYLWSIFIFNILWLLIQSALTFRILKRNDTFLHEWVIINFITVAYLSVFVFAYPSLLGGNSSGVGKNEYLNFQIVLVLVFRTVADYTVGWKKVYNKETK
jgi:hypothetical protein